MCKLLLRSYFNIKNTFDGIQDEDFFDIVKLEAKKSNQSVEDLCFSMIGYNNKKEWEDRKNGVYTINTNSTLQIVPEDITTSKNLDAILTVSNFIEHSDLKGLTDGDKPVSFSDFFFTLKLESRKGINKLLSDKDNTYLYIIQSLLDNATFSKEIEKSFSLGGELFLTNIPTKSRTKFAMDVIKQISCRNFTIANKHFDYIRDNLSSYLIFDISNDDYSKLQRVTKHDEHVYKNFTQIAMIYDLSISHLIQYCGFDYVDQLSVYNKIGFCMFPVGTDFWMIDIINENNSKLCSRMEFLYND